MCVATIFLEGQTETNPKGWLKERDKYVVGRDVRQPEATGIRGGWRARTQGAKTLGTGKKRRKLVMFVDKTHLLPLDCG